MAMGRFSCNARGSNGNVGGSDTVSGHDLTCLHEEAKAVRDVAVTPI